MTRIITIFLFAFLLNSFSCFSQILINEVSYANADQITDEDGDHPDWIELMNLDIIPLNLKGYKLADGPNSKNKWTLPDLTLVPGDRILVYASGKDRPKAPVINNGIDHWETAVYDDNTWSYKVGDATIPGTWKNPGFNSASWSKGPGGIGYGDGDDNITVPDGTISVFAITSFNVLDPSVIAAAIFNMDYDDGFVAYLNGTEIAREGLSSPNPKWDEFSTEHEAELYNGGLPVKYELDLSFIKSLLVTGTNVLAVQVHNLEPISSDLTMRPFLHFGLNTSSVYWGPNPSWFDENSSNGPGELHTNFKLKAGETLVLWDSSGLLLDSITLQTIDIKHVRARIPDGNKWCITDSPSPGDSNDNSTCYLAYAKKPDIDLASGFYSSSQNVGIIGNEVRYTLDGSIPDQSSTLYTTSLNINSSTVVKAIAYENGKLPSDIVTATYFINESTQLPVVSISAKPADLFDDGSGGIAIYDNYWTGESAACRVSYFDKDKNLKFEENAAVKVVGNFSVSFDQKSLQFIFDEDYGAKDDVPNDIFKADKPHIKTLHGFRVRNTDDDATAARMRDPIANRIALPTNAVVTASQNVAVFINGEYWGHYSARELLNEHFFRDNYGVNTDSIDIIKTYYNNGTQADHGTIEGFNNMVDYITNNDFSDSLEFEKAKALVDVENWADYWATQIFVANGDWYHSVWYNNIESFTSYDPDIKWKFVLWDLGYSQGNGQFDCEASYNSLYAALADPVKQNVYGPMFVSLLANQSFKTYFINRFADLLNYYWTTEKVHNLIQKNVLEMQSEIQPNFNRWDPGCNNYCPPDLSSWQFYVDDLKDFYIERPPYQREHINDYFSLGGQVDVTLDVMPPGAGQIKISTIIPNKLPWTGIYFDGNPVEITANPNPGFTFSNWSTNKFIGNPDSSGFTANIDENTVFTANFSGSPQALNLTFSEINYNSDSTTSSGNWVELHNFGNTPTDISGFGFTTKNSTSIYTIPQNTVIQPNAYLVLVDDLDKFKEEFPGVTNVLGPTDIKLDNGQDTVYLLDKLFQFALTASYFDNNPWPQTADGYGRTLENAFKDDLSHLMDPSGWFAGCMGGSPGKAFEPCIEPVIFNEINYNPATDHDAGDWIELLNNSGQSQDISGWKITDSNNSNSFEFPTGTIIPADSFLVVFSDINLFNDIHPDDIPLAGPFEFGLGSNGEIIRLYDQTGTLNLSMYYNDVAPWPTEPDGEGPTLELITPGTDLNLGANWEPSCEYGTPARPNTDCNTASSNLKPLQFTVTPNPSKGLFELNINQQINGSWKVLTTSGVCILKETYINSGKIQIDLENQVSGIYILQVISSKGTENIKLVKE